jgi:transposase
MEWLRDHRGKPLAGLRHQVSFFTPPRLVSCRVAGNATLGHYRVARLSEKFGRGALGFDNRVYKAFPSGNETVNRNKFGRAPTFPIRFIAGLLLIRKAWAECLWLPQPRAQNLPIGQ